MNKSTLQRVLDSHLFFALLLCSILALGALWFRNHDEASVPALANYNWQAHPKAVLMVVPEGDCGCGMKPLEMARASLAHNVDFVLVSGKESEAIAALRKAKLPANRVFVASGVDQGFIKRFSRTKNVVAVVVERGSVVYKAEGNMPQEFFDQFHKGA